MRQFRVLYSAGLIFMLAGIVSPVSGANQSASSAPPARIETDQLIKSRLPITCIFIDRQQHRLLAQIGRADSGPTPFVWITRGHPQKLRDVQSYLYSIVGVDFQRQLIILFVKPGPDGWLAFVPFSKAKHFGPDLEALQGQQDGRVTLFVFGKQPERNYRVYFPTSTDVTAPEAWAGIYDGNRLIRRVEVGYLPKQMLYVPAIDQVYLVYDWQLKTLSGKVIPLPTGRPPNSPGQYDPEMGLPISVIDAEPSGQIAYYIDSKTDLIYKLDLANGKVLAERRLPFTPISLALDSGQQAIYLLDTSGKRITRVHTF